MVTACEANKVGVTDSPGEHTIRSKLGTNRPKDRRDVRRLARQLLTAVNSPPVGCITAPNAVFTAHLRPDWFRSERERSASGAERVADVAKAYDVLQEMQHQGPVQYLLWYRGVHYKYTCRSMKSP